MGLHSSLLERIGWVWLGEAWIWLALQQCPEVVWKCGCIHRSLCVSGQGCCVVCLCDGRETTIGCLGNKSFPWPTFLHVFYHISLSLSRHLCLLLSFPPSFSLGLSTSVSRARALRDRRLDFVVVGPVWWLFPFGMEGISVSVSIPCWVLKMGSKGKL